MTTMKRKKRRKKTDKPSKTEIRKILGIKSDPKPRVNRKKLARDVEKRFRSTKMNAFDLELLFCRVVGYMFGRINGKTDKPSPVTTALGLNRITDEEVGFLKFIEAILNLYDQREQVKTFMDELNVIEGLPIGHDRFAHLVRNGGALHGKEEGSRDAGATSNVYTA